MEAPTSAPTILVVEDFEPVRRLLARLLGEQRYHVRLAEGGLEALAVVAQNPPDVVLTDLEMPGGDGLTLCRALKASPATRLIPVVIMTGLAEAGVRVQAIEAGADDFLTKPVDHAELKARVRSLVSLKRFTDDLDSAETVLRSLALTIEARDAYTRGHCDRLGDYGAALAADLGLAEDDIAAVRRGGYFHDIGKIAIPDAILLKRGSLTEDEYAKIREHPVVGEQLCGNLRVLRRVRPIIRWHHERLDGSGYPDRLVGDAIPLTAQIIGIVDVFDALTTARPYRAALSVEAALAELEQEVTRGWRNRELVERFIQLCRRRPPRGGG